MIDGGARPRGRTWRRALLIVPSAALLVACALVTDLDGLSNGVRAEADANGGGDATELRDANASDPGLDAGSEAGIGTLAQDGFETPGKCAPWEPYLATAESVATPYAGARACRICLTTNGASGGIRRRFPGTGAGSYHVRGRAKPLDAVDWRVTMTFEVDGGDLPSYNSGPFAGDDWHAIEMNKVVGPEYTELEVALWFGTEFGAGDCMLVDEVTVSRDP